MEQSSDFFPELCSEADLRRSAHSGHVCKFSLGPPQIHPARNRDRHVEISLQDHHTGLFQTCVPRGRWELAEASSQLGSRASCPALLGGLPSFATWVVCLLAVRNAAGVHSPLWGT